MNAMMTSLALTASGSVAINAVPSNPVVNGSSSGHARFKRLGAATTLSSSASRGLNQAQEGFSRKLARRRNSKVAVALVRIPGVAGVEAPPVDNIKVGDQVHNVVIVGAGIAGLSAALALHRVGVKVRVLEQNSLVRASGASLALWGNAWRALEYLGVADGLREKHVLASRVAMYDRSEKLLRSFLFSECPGGPHEVRGVERKLLVEALAAQLPAGTIQLNSRARTIRREPGDVLTKVELEDGRVISTNVLVGCDGVNSVVARWMGLPPQRYVGQIGIRGVAEYPSGHDFGTTVAQYLGKGQRCGIFPFSDSKVYWFYAFNSASPGPKVTDPNLVKAEVLRALEDGWPDKMKELVINTPTNTMSRTAMGDRFNIPGVTPALIQERVALAGDAMHPMTPNLGQGGGTAIEDGIVLARTLGAVLSQDGDADSIQKALEEYAALRQERTFPLTVKAFIAGAFLMADFPPIVYVRDNIAIPKLLSPSSFLSHTLFDVGKLPTSKITAE